MGAEHQKQNKGLSGNSIAGMYQGFIPEFNEPIVLRLDADGNAQYITTPELLRETAALGTWKFVSRGKEEAEIELVTVIYIRDEFCGVLYEEPGLLDCMIYGGGTLSVTRDGKLSGSYGFSFAPSADPDNVINLGIFTLDLERQPMELLLQKAITPTP